MKGLNTFLQTIRAQVKSGKLDDAEGRELEKAATRLQHFLRIGDRRKAQYHFELLCQKTRDILDRDKSN